MFRNTEKIKNNILLQSYRASEDDLYLKKLSNFGANISKCFDGKEIISLIEKNPAKYHLIITDINMTDIGGIEAAKKVREIQLEYNTKVHLCIYDI
ncbi:hypothetical protein N9X24_01985 [Rickettsiales bacterium]|nr:hypothetical protein [Rickettsiales bacterium]